MTEAYVAYSRPRVKVSVVVPLYNVSEYIGETVAQFQKQTLEQVEYIFVDDGSTDQTVAKLREFLASEPRATLVCQENQGASAARNHGLRLASGEYVCFADADDLVADDALNLMYTAAVAHDADVVTGGTLRFNNARQWRMRSYVAHGIFEPGTKTLETHPGLMYALGPCAKLFRRELVAGHFFPEDIHVGEDQPFVLALYARAKTIYTIDAVVYYYRERESGPESLTQQALDRPLEALEDLYKTVGLVRQTLGNTWMFDFYLQRAMSADIWPRLRAAIGSGDSSVQSAVFRSLRAWLNGFDKDTFGRASDLYFFPLIGSVSFLGHLRRSSFREFMRLERAVLAKMTLRSYGHLAAMAVTRAADAAGHRLRR